MISANTPISTTLCHRTFHIFCPRIKAIGAHLAPGPVVESMCGVDESMVNQFDVTKLMMETTM